MVVYQVKSYEYSYGERHSWIREGLIFSTKEKAQDFINRVDKYRSKIIEVEVI